MNGEDTIEPVLFYFNQRLSYLFWLNRTVPVFDRLPGRLARTFPRSSLLARSVPGLSPLHTRRF